LVNNWTQLGLMRGPYLVISETFKFGNVIINFYKGLSDNGETWSYEP